VPSTLFRIESFVVNTADNTISCDERAVKVEPKCIKVLNVLADNAPEAVSREYIHKAVWGERVVVDEALSRVISQLRHALNDNKSKRLIKTIPKLGYKLTVTPSYVNSETSKSDARAPKTSSTQSLSANSHENAAHTNEKTTRLEGNSPELLDSPERKDSPELVDSPQPANASEPTSTRSDTNANKVSASTSSNARHKVWLAIVALIVIAALFFTMSRTTILKTDSQHETSQQGITTSVAILPFSQISDDTDSSYISLGLTEEISSSLSTTPGFNVPSRYSTLALTKQGLSLADIAKTLNVNYALEGSVRRINQSFRISVRLIAPYEDKTLWSEQYDVTSNDLLKVQLDISNAIITRVSATNTASESVLKSGITDNAAAYQAYLKGTYWWMNGTTSEWFTKAEKAFLQAVNQDPTFSAAYGSLAYIYARYNFYDLYIPQEEALPKANAAIDSALRLNPYDANAHNATAILATLDYRFDDAQAALNRVLSRNADNSTSLYLSSELALAKLQPERALSLAQQALDKEPLSPWVNVNLAIVHYWRGETSLALATLKRALEIDDMYTWAYVWKARILALEGNNAAAIEAMEACLSIDPFSSVNAAYLGNLHSLAGNNSKATQWFTHAASLLGDSTIARFWKTHASRLRKSDVTNTDIALMESLLSEQTQAFSVIPLLTDGYIATEQQKSGYEVILNHFPSLTKPTPIVNSHNVEAALALVRLSSDAPQKAVHIEKALNEFLRTYSRWAALSGLQSRYDKLSKRRYKKSEDAS
jgi:DNA-binding winged helix-turn-helix (wHTH) protein/TolB-like protein